MRVGSRRAGNLVPSLAAMRDITTVKKGRFYQTNFDLNLTRPKTNFKPCTFRPKVTEVSARFTPKTSSTDAPNAPKSAQSYAG